MKEILAYIKSRYDIFVLGGMILLTEVLLRASVGMDLYSGQALAFDLTSIVVLLGVIAFFKRKTRHILEFIVILYLALYSFAQSVHYVFFKNLFSYRKLSLASELVEVKDEVLSGLRIEHILFIMPILVVVFLFFIQRGKERTYDVKIRILIALLCAIIGISINLLMVAMLRADYKIDNSWNKDYYLHEVMQNRYKFLDRFGIIEYNYKDIAMTFTDEATELSEDERSEVDAFISEYSERTQDEYSGMFEGKNLVLVLCESFDESAIDPELTPTLYKLKSEGYYFDEHYAPLYEVATGDSEFISQTGMLPSVNNGTTSYTFNLNDYPYALANLFKDKGYEVNSYHSYTGNFYNRESIHESFGYSTFYDMDKLGLERWSGYEETKNWILDEDLFYAVLENTPFDSESPFFDFVVTVSGHMPYDKRRDELSEYYDIIKKDSRFDDYSEEAIYYLAAQMSLDRGIEVLLKGLEERGELEDTVIYLFADHYPYGITTSEGKADLLGDTDSYEVYKVPMIIYSQDEEAKTFKTLTSTFDIYPTIADLFALDDSKAYKVGRSIFDQSEERFVVFFDRSFLTEYFYYDTREDNIPEDYSELYEKIAKKVNDIFYYSQKILLADYYREDR